jgi:hypothetical protein
MAVQEGCRHYLRRSTVAGDAFERCRLEAGETEPRFACPEGCLFFEERTVKGPGWVQDPDRGQGR